MSLWLTLLLASPSNWQDAFRLEKADAELPPELALRQVEKGNLEWFVRSNQSVAFDEVMSVALRDDDRDAVLLACKLPDPHRNERLWTARNVVEQGLACNDKLTCGQLVVAVRDMREACIDLAVARWHGNWDYEVASR